MSKISAAEKAASLFSESSIQTLSLAPTALRAGVAPRSAKSMGIPETRNLTGIEIRIAKLHILDNGTPYIPPFVRYSNLYVLAMAIDDLTGKVDEIRLEGFDDVDDDEQLSVDRTLYYWKQTAKNQKCPSQVHVLLSVIKSKRATRDFGDQLLKLQGTPDFKRLAASAVAAIAAPQAALANALIKVSGLVVGNLLKNSADVALYTAVRSYTDINGDFDTLGRHDIQHGNRNVDAVTRIIVRDSARDPSPNGD
jgi:hypothetical protein